MKEEDPKGPSEGEYRTYRGAAFYCHDTADTTAQYGEFAVPSASHNLGLRIACNGRKQ